jgi:glycerate kinase
VRILVAPDKFKGSLSATDVAEAIAAGLRDAAANLEVETCAIADGGEETAELIRTHRGGDWVTCTAHDALGREIQVRYVTGSANSVVVMDMSEACGLSRIASHERDPVRATTFGVGEMIVHAARRGASQIVVGLGGSATNDGGIGMARALGFRFWSSRGEMIETPQQLVELVEIRLPSSPERLPRIIAAVDVRNPLLGPFGATRTFGVQKGATASALEILEAGLTRLAEVATQTFGRDDTNTHGAGAAGGLGFGLAAFCDATIRSGFEVVAEAVDLELKMQRADLVITGEGRLDLQTMNGKGPAGVLQLARRLGKHVVAIVGSVVGDQDYGFDEVISLESGDVRQAEAITRPAELLRERSADLARRRGAMWV